MQRKFVLSFLCLAFLMFNCTSEKNNSPEAENKALAQSMFTAFNAHDWKRMAGYYSNDALFLDPASGPAYVSMPNDSIIKKYTEMAVGAPDIKDSIVGLFAEGDKVSVQFVSSGTSNGEHWELPIATVLTISKGKIIRDATYYDK